MGLRKPAKKDIRSGNVVDIYNREGIREGKAELIRRAPSKYIADGLPYIRYDKSPDEDDSQCYIWSYERWLVRWVNHPRLRAGDRSTVEVNYFVKLARSAPSLYDNEITPQDTEIRLLFLELTGTLQINGGEVCCVTDLNKVWRSFKKPDCILYVHNQLQARELFELHGVKARIAGFIDPKECSFEEGILSYLEEHTWQDFMVLTGDFDSKLFKRQEIKDRTIRSNPIEGLKWIKRKK